MSSLNPMGIFRGMGSSNNKPTSTASIVVLTEEEKQLRRERLSAAAQDRSKTWDKKLGQKKKSSGSAAEITDANASSFSNAGGENTNAETERAIRKTKELEEKIEKVSRYYTLYNIIPSRADDE